MKIKTSALLLLATIIVLSSDFVRGQNFPSELKLDDIYKNRVYGQEAYGPVRWMKDNKAYSTLERNKEEGPI